MSIRKENRTEYTVILSGLISTLVCCLQRGVYGAAKTVPTIIAAPSRLQQGSITSINYMNIPIKMSRIRKELKDEYQCGKLQTEDSL